jgi:S-DNA-T family DNA segregation ATPase FtsK/SpoIIIE
VTTEFAPESAIGWDFTRVIKGEIVNEPAAPAVDDDDIAPGIVETYEPTTPVLYRAGSAAMVVASVTGRAAGLSARGAWVFGGWFGHGLKAGTYLAYRYVRAHDLQETLGGMSKSADWNKVQIVRKSRWRFLGIAAGVTAALNLAGWWALVAGAGMTALDYSWALPPTATGLIAATAIALYGRYRLTTPQLAPGQIVAEQDDPNSDEPFPLSYCVGGEQVIECVSRALAHEGIGTRSIDVLGHREWGWEIDVVLKGSTPGKVNAAADALDALFDIKRGGTLIEPDLDASAHLVLRLVTADPFANMPRPAVHGPNSLSVRDVAVRGRSMDGAPLELRLRGMSMLIIGKSGSAKTKGALRCIAETITACRDAIAIEMDPVKGGLREFEGVMAAPPIRGGKDCTEWLSRLVRIASARNEVKHQRGMGDLWEPSAEYPAIYVIVDEFIYLPKEAKALAIELLRIGRETGVFLIFAAQEGTEDSLGDAIADSVTYRVMLASRAEDIRLVLGTGAAAAGYRPDRLQPAVDDDRVYDAGKAFIRGPGYDRPILWKWDRIGRDQIMQAVADRKEAGRPWFDQDSLAAADLLHVITRSSTAGKATLADRLDALAAQGGIDDARLVAVLLREYDTSDHHFLPTSEVLLPALHDAGAEDMDANKLSQLLRSHAPNATAGKEKWDDRPQVRGWHRSTVERAAAGLIDPSKARLQAA